MAKLLIVDDDIRLRKLVNKIYHKIPIRKSFLTKSSQIPEIFLTKCSQLTFIVKRDNETNSCLWNGTLRKILWCRS